jgi:DNA polymerase (family 10)
VSRNAEVASLLEEFADRLEAQEVEYKPRAYRRAAENVRDHPARIEQLAAEGPDAVAEIEGVGDAIASKIVEYVESGEIEELDELRAELPVDIEALGRIEGLGPKRIGALYRALGVETLDDLAAAAEAEEIRTVDGFGPKTEQSIADGIEFAREAQARTSLGEARPIAAAVVEHLESTPADAVDPAGSIRRWCPTVGDVDILASAVDSGPVIDALITWDRATEIESGDTKASVRIDGTRVDLRVVDPASAGAALQYFTGNRDHNVTLRERAIERGFLMNEYGVFPAEDADDVDPDHAPDDSADGPSDTDNTEPIAGETEAGMYEAVDLPWIPPELREDRCEVAAAADGELPDLIQPGALRGDLHTHTDWSDGALPIADLVAAAAEHGHDYLAITDHATGPGMVGGVGCTDDELREQLPAIREVADDAAIDVFAGVETNIDAGGDLSTADDVLADLDLVVAAPHSGLGQDPDYATDRLVRAVEHPEVDILGHPTGRLIGTRSGLDPDIERVAAAAAENDTALEINANPSRLDLSGAAVRVAIEAGATIAINTDAHSPPEFAYLPYGLHTARRGWAEPDDVLNAGSADEVRAFLN